MTEFNPGNPKAVVFDLDKTVLVHNGKRSPFDWSDLSGDTPIEGIKSIINSFYNSSIYIIFLTGRPESSRRNTESWLKDNKIKYNSLIMKEGSPYQKSAITKRESMLEIQKDFNVLLVFEDMQPCVDMYKDLGLIVCQVHTKE